MYIRPSVKLLTIWTFLLLCSNVIAKYELNQRNWDVKNEECRNVEKPQIGGKIWSSGKYARNLTAYILYIVISGNFSRHFPFLTKSLILLLFYT